MALFSVMLSAKEVPMDGLGQRVKLTREARGWTRRELAKQAGLHEMHLAKVEREGRPRIEGDTILKLAQALGCTTDYLMGRTDDPRPPKRPRPRTPTPVG